MVTQINIIKQTPSADNLWLYKEDNNGVKTFSKEVYLPLNAPLWEECDNAVKEEYDKAEEERLRKEIEEIEKQAEQ
jgi:hypothetical protein